MSKILTEAYAMRNALHKDRDQVTNLIQRLIEEIERLEAKAGGESSFEPACYGAWQSIETAPKDEYPILGFIGVPWIFVWQEKEQRWHGVVPFDGEYAYMWIRNNPNQPTHWMPLPPAP